MSLRVKGIKQADTLLAPMPDMERRYSFPLVQRHLEEVYVRQHSYKISKEARKKLETAQVQAIPDIIRAESTFARTGWILMLIGAAIGCLIQIYLVVQDYHENATATKIEYLRPSDPVEFPPISICFQMERNINSRLALDDMKSGLLTREYINAVEWGLGLVRDFDWDWTSKIEDDVLEDNYDLAIQTHGSIIAAKHALQDKYGVTCETNFKACWKDLNTRFNCCDVFELHYNMHGACISSKPGALVAKHSGNLNAYRFEVWIWPLLDPVSIINGSIHVNLSDHRNVVGIMPSTNLDQSPQYPQMEYMNYQESVIYKVKKNVRKIVNKRSRPCYKSPKIKYFRDFTPNNCDWEHNFFDKLNLTCQLPVLELLSGRTKVTKPCNLTTIRQIYNLYQNSTGICGYWCQYSILKEMEPRDNNCTNLPCTYVHYPMTSTKLLDKSDDHRVFSVQMQFDTLEVEVIEEIDRLNPNDLIGIIGGIFGLWLGASLTSIVHFMAMIVTLGIDYFKYRSKKAREDGKVRRGNRQNHDHVTFVTTTSSPTLGQIDVDSSSNISVDKGEWKPTRKRSIHSLILFRSESNDTIKSSDSSVSSAKPQSDDSGVGFGTLTLEY